MKRRNFLVAFVTALAVAVAPLITYANVPAYFSEEDLELLPPQIVLDGRSLMPIRAVTEMFGGSLTWDGDLQQVLIAQQDTRIALTIDSTQAIVNGLPVELEVPVQIVGGNTMVPMSFIQEYLYTDFEVDFHLIPLNIDMFLGSQNDERIQQPNISGSGNQQVSSSSTVTRHTSIDNGFNGNQLVTITLQNDEGIQQHNISGSGNQQVSSSSTVTRHASIDNRFNRNQLATITFTGEPNTVYYGRPIFNSGPSQAQGLGRATSNSEGVVSWTWRIGRNTAFGNYNFIVRQGGSTGQEVSRINFSVNP